MNRTRSGSKKINLLPKILQRFTKTFPQNNCSAFLASYLAIKWTGERHKCRPNMLITLFSDELGQQQDDIWPGLGEAMGEELLLWRLMEAAQVPLIPVHSSFFIIFRTGQEQRTGAEKLNESFEQCYLKPVVL